MTKVNKKIIKYQNSIEICRKSIYYSGYIVNRKIGEMGV